MTLAIILLAAGHGTRMNSRRQKVLHDIGGKPMVLHPFEAAESIADVKPGVVVGAGEEGVRRLLGQRARYVVQEQRLGTGHATQAARETLVGRADQVLVTYGDMPLLQAETMGRLARMQAQSGAAVVMLTVMGDAQSSFGRVLRDDDGDVLEIVEVAQARTRDDADDLLAIRELNAGVYCFDDAWLWENVSNLPLRQARSGPEDSLTDMVGLAVAQGRQVRGVEADDPDEGLSAGTRAELAGVERAFRRRINRRWMQEGVTLVDPHNTYIDAGVQIGQDTIIWPNTFLQGKTVIGQDCVIGPNSILRNTTVGNGAHVAQMFLEDSAVAEGAVIHPEESLKAKADD